MHQSFTVLHISSLQVLFVHYKFGDNLRLVRFSHFRNYIIEWRCRCFALVDLYLFPKFRQWEHSLRWNLKRFSLLFEEVICLHPISGSNTGFAKMQQSRIIDEAERVEMRYATAYFEKQ